MSEAYYEEHPTDPSRVILRKPVTDIFDYYIQESRLRELEACCTLLEGMHYAAGGTHNYYLHAANELRKMRGKK